MPGRVVGLLWVTPAVVWLIVSVFWLYHAFADSQPGWPAMIATSLIPLTVGIPLLVAITPMHPGGYMLILSGLLAVGARRRMA